jgi:hypothetical protein
MSEFNEQLFIRVCTLEAELELLTKKLYDAEEKVKCLEKLLYYGETYVKNNQV